MTTTSLITKAEAHDYQSLFIQDLHWGAPNHKPSTYTDDDGRTVTATNVSSYEGIRVWVCPERPGPKLEAQLDRVIAKTSTDRIVIFHSGDDQVWRWPVRRNTETSTTTRLTSHRHRTGTVSSKLAERLDTIRLPIQSGLSANDVLTQVRAAFDVEARNETRRASRLMANMYAAMEKAYPSSYTAKTRDHQISVTLARVLFLIFGDDTDMWTADLFRDFVHETAGDGSNVANKMNQLFKHLDTPPGDIPAAPELANFPYVNGGIFLEPVTLPALNAEFRTAILAACDVDWSTISPAIFGSMFQSVRDAKTRRELGEHYTSEENILKTLNPLFLDELRAELARVHGMKLEGMLLRRLWERIGDIRYMDPACGCGNFIIVAYRELRELELEIMERLQELGGDTQLSLDPTLDLRVTLDHFYGIEIDEWPAKIAETAMFLIDRQGDLKLKERFGEAPQRLPIRRHATIVAGTSALLLGWETICPPSSDVVVAGNPPFLGHATRSNLQARELRTVWGTDDISRLDYVTGWHAKTLRYFGGLAGRWAFVTTNSIVQGDPVPHLFGPIFGAGWRIRFAHRTFPWSSESPGSAAVHCVIVGFDREGSSPRLFDYESRRVVETHATNINAYLVACR